MAYSDPQTITISGTGITLPRVSTGENNSKYLSSDGLVALSASSSYGKRTRQVLRVDHSKIAPDTFVPAQNVKQSMSCYIVFDRPAVGYTVADALAVYTGFNTLYTASSSALISKLLAGES